MRISSSMAALLALGSALWALPVSAQVGRLHISRQVVVSQGAVMPGAAPRFVAARDGQPIEAGQAVRTLKRSTAEVAFRDGSVLRINERSDVIIREPGALQRDIALTRGAVWIRVARGVRTRIETPSATATARGTEFEVRVEGNQTRVVGLVDQVDVESGGRLLVLDPGKTSLVAGMGAPPSAPARWVPDPDGAWWEQMEGDQGLLVTPGSAAFQPLRAAPLTEAAQQTANLPSLLLQNDSVRERLFQVSDQVVAPRIRPYFANDGSLTITKFKDQYGTWPANHFFGLNTSDDAFFRSLGIASVGQWFDILAQNGIEVFLRPGRGRFYRAGALTAAPTLNPRLFDRTETSDTILLAGLAASLAANGNDWAFSPPKTVSEIFGFSAAPQLVGARQEIRAALGKTRLRFEANAIQLTDLDRSGRYVRSPSVASVEREIGSGLTVFAGRRRFYHGPVFQNQNQSQLIGDRYSAVGAAGRRGRLAGEAAYLYDANPEVGGAQGGALASAYVKAGGGIFGAHYLRVPQVRSGSGFTFSSSFPVAPGQLEMYTEIGRGPDSARLETVGFYAPGLYQRADIDLFIEYGSHEGLGSSIAAIANREFGKNLALRLFGNWRNGGKDFASGVGLLARFGGP